MTTPRTWGLLATTAVVSIVLVVLPGTARSAYPGANGMIAFTSNRDDPFGAVYTMNADGSGVTRLDLGRTIESPAWSPDGTQLAFASKRDGFDDIYVMDVASGNVRRLTTGSETDFQPTWSPDGGKIAFVSDRDQNNEIYVMDADGSDQRRLTNNPGDDGDPQWSPNANRIAFYSSRDGFFKEVYVMDAADGGNVTTIVPGGSITDSPSWSPDGSKIAFRSQGEIYTVDRATGAQTNLTNNASPDREPAWSPDGTKIAFVSFRDGNAELYVMDVDGSNQTRLTDNGATDSEPDWQPLPPPPPPPGPCLVLSTTSVAISGTASTPSTPGRAESEHLTVRNCGDSAVHLNARATDATGSAGTWQLTNDSDGGSVCGVGVNVFRAHVTLWLSGQAATPLSTSNTPLVGTDGSTPFTLGAAADQELSAGADLPCVGSVGLGDPMTTNVTLTAVAP